MQIWNAQDSVLNLVGGYHYSISLYADTYGGVSGVAFQPVPAPSALELLELLGLRVVADDDNHQRNSLLRLKTTIHNSKESIW